MLGDAFLSAELCAAKSFQNVSGSDILAGRPVIAEPKWPSPVTRMAVALFGRVCDACPSPADAIFARLELIQTLSRGSDSGPVSVSHAVLLTGVA